LFRSSQAEIQTKPSFDGTHKENICGLFGKGFLQSIIREYKVGYIYTAQAKTFN